MTMTNTWPQDREVETSSSSTDVVLMTPAQRADFLLDEALKDTFPASDPVCLSQIS